MAAAAGPFLFLTEGVLPYCREAEVRPLSDRFPGAELVTYATSPLLAWVRHFDPKMGAVARQIHWTLRHARDLESCVESVRLLSEWFYFDALEPRLGATRLMRFVPALGRGAGIYHCRLGNAAD